MPASDPATSPAGTENALAGSITGKNELNTKGTAQSAKASAQKLSGAELKAQKKAEKAARRQQEIQARQSGPVASIPASGGKSQAQSAQSQRGKGESSAGQHRRTGSTVDVRNAPLKGSQAATTQPEEPRREDKTVELFRHLYKARATTISGASKEVHPAVLALGQQMSSYTICGSNARLVATLQAFKRVSSKGFHLFLGMYSLSLSILQIGLCSEY